eukprot:CAMPEP_0114442010 /NCGR_PEP_ID=MMETSP0103-20121206/16692_1 /TAXON_ID=37642 ORGANISM="Paraphysomonas imperforata, Strain PA2" /NCGR_SAMPLE_ID=MMETSP0103 /ASSEMBLY_ACC=CAM_ASM_000201 /LENGTH=34 /DNA_ID= /DNA_START= /DNA_END= /DNA_ORIENTATION=
MSEMHFSASEGTPRIFILVVSSTADNTSTKSSMR